MKWIVKHFNELTAAELYVILQLRCKVFVVEQQCPYLDEDDKDQQSYHLMGWKGKQLVAYARLLPSGISYEEASIGRVATDPSARGSGLGKELMRQSVVATQKLFEVDSIKIGAQLYLKTFYESMGFQQVSDIYLEDGIKHIEMLRKNQATFQID